MVDCVLSESIVIYTYNKIKIKINNLSYSSLVVECSAPVRKFVGLNARPGLIKDIKSRA